MLYENILLRPLIDLSVQHPEKVVLQNGRKNLSAKALLDKSRLLASDLSKKGMAEGDVVLLAVIPGAEFLIIFYSLLILRVRIAIIDSEMGEENYKSKMEQLGPAWLFADSRLLLVSKFKRIRQLAGFLKKNIPKLYLGREIKIVSTGFSIPFFYARSRLKDYFSGQQNDIKLEKNNHEYECLIIYTSGTLGTPKGVVHTNNSLNATLLKLAGIFKNDENIILATCLPQFMLLGIACNFRVKIIRRGLSAKRKLTWFEKEKITVYFGAPFDYLPLIEFCEKERIAFPSCLCHLIAGTAPVHRSFLKRLINVLPEHVKITCTYGMTEHLVTALADGRRKILYEATGDFLGEIAEGVEIKIGDDHEIYVKSEQLFKRYLHQQESLSMHATGDQGKTDNEGNLILTGRKKDMIIRRDFNIYPALYEDTVRKIPGITEAAFIGIYDESLFDEIVYLIIETETGVNENIFKYLKEGIFSIDAGALPDMIIKMKMPRSGRHHKIDKLKIAEMIKNNEL